MKTAILTGVTGFVGLNLLEELLNNDVFVYAIVRPYSKKLDRLLDKFGNHKNIQLIQLDIADIDRLISLDIKADTFYHCVWEGDRHSYEEQIKNMESSMKAFETAKILNIKHFIGIGSQAEYGIYNHRIDEDKICRPVNAYGMCKLTTYRMLKNLSIYHDIKFTWIRLFSAYGKYDNPNTLIEQLINNLQKNQYEKIHSSEKKWEYIHIKDVSSALYLLGENVIEGLYNLSSGETRLIKDFVEDVISIINPNIIIDYYNNYSEDETQISCNIDKIKSVIDWEPQINFKDGIKYGL